MFQITMTPLIIRNHYNRVYPEIKKNAQKLKSSNSNPFLDKSMQQEYDTFLDEIANSNPNDEKSLLWRIICSTPRELMNIYKDNESWFEKLSQLEVKEKEKKPSQKARMEIIFDYKEFVQKKIHAYALTKDLNVNVCPYCNQSFIYTVTEEIDKVNIVSNRNQESRKYIMRPELDHYFPQSKYPMFALSVYNLIPCCHNCNSIMKGSKDLQIEDFYHPYIKEEKAIGIKYSFILCESSKTEIRIRTEKGKAENTANFFALNEIYKVHNDESNHLYELYQQYPRDYIEEIYNSLNKVGLPITKAQLIRMVYDHFCVKNPDNEILGNLRHDLFEQIKKQYKK